MSTPLDRAGQIVRSILRTTGCLVLSGAAALFVGVDAYLATYYLVPIEPFGRIATAGQTSDATLLDRNGVPLQRIRLDFTRRQLDWVSLNEVSPAALRALVAAEDQRFYAHGGIDGIAVVGGLLDKLRGTRRGASTISMQVAALLTEGPHRSDRRDIWAKLKQARAALALERDWSKQQILEAYVNLLNFRNDLVGLRAASLGLLRMGPGGLDDAQSAVLAALVRAPSAQRWRVGRRACGVLRVLGRSEACAQAQFIASGLPQRPWPIAPAGLDEAAHLARRLLTAPGQRLQSTLDAHVQRFAAETLRARLSELQERNVEDGAVVVIDNASGDVLAYVGSSGNLSEADQVDAVAALRQPGSALKPFIYAEAIERRWLTAASVLEDTPMAIDTAGGLYAPQDYERDFKGTVSVRTALASSLNVPAVRALALVGLARANQRLRELGFTSLTHDAEHYGVGLALGDCDVTLLDLTNAYRALANGGQWSPVRLRLGAVSSQPPRRVFSRATSFIVADILADGAARAPTFGFASPLSARTWAAVKTGTSKGMRDNWAIGFTDRFTVGVWVGNASGAPMWDVSGVSGAAPVWQAIVEHLHSNLPAASASPPEGLSRRAVRFAGGFEASREEWFLAGTELQDVQLPFRDEVRPRLIEPPDGTRIAPDPDIPLSRQKIRVRANVAADGAHCLRLNERPLAPCGVVDALIALPPSGRHRITLTDPAGSVLGETRIEVRAPPPPAIAASGAPTRGQ